MNREQIELIGRIVGGTFHAYEGNILVYSSHDFPAHRIEVTKENAEKFLKELVATVIGECRE